MVSCDQATVLTVILVTQSIQQSSSCLPTAQSVHGVNPTRSPHLQVLPCAADSVRDEHQAQALLALAYSLGPAPTATPRDVQVCCGTGCCILLHVKRPPLARF